MSYAPIPLETERVASQTGAATEVHRQLGPGFLERIYQEALCLELDAGKMPLERERPVAVHYRVVPIPGQRIDLIVAGCVIVELKLPRAWTLRTRQKSSRTYGPQIFASACS